MKKPILIYTTLITAFVLLTSAELFAQFTLTGELRPRAEFRNGFKKLKDKNMDPAFFIEQRSRLYFNFKRDNIELHMALQDVRIWGATNQIYKYDPALTNFYEAWASYQFTNKWGVKLGRQALDYDNARFLGNLDWAQQGRSHDALLFTMSNAERDCKLHLGGAFNQSANPPEFSNLEGTDYLGINNYKFMFYGWWNKKFENGGMSVLFQNDGRQVAEDTSTASRQTYAVLGNMKVGNVTLDGELYYQGGKNGNNLNVSALMVTVHGTLKTDLTPLTLGIEYLSGTKLGESDDKSFNPLYGTNHKFYGFMDYFYVGNGHGQVNGRTSGLLDVHFKTKFKLGEKSNLAANLHWFSSPVTIYENSDMNGTSMSSSLGTELDLVFTKVLSKDAKFNIGYSQMFGTETMEAIKGGGDRTAFNNWIWAMIAFKPQLFTTKKDD